MNLAIVYDALYPFGFGGGEKRNWEIARRLAARGHSVTLASVQTWEGDAEFLREGVRCRGVCAWRPNLSAGGKRAWREPLYFARHVFSFLRRESFDLVDCSNFPYLSCLAARAALRRRPASSLVITWYEVRGWRGWMEHRGALGLPAWVAERLVSRLRARHAAISDFTRARAERMMGMRGLEVVPCGVDCAAAARAAAPGRAPQILFVGRLVRHKRVDFLLRAFASVTSRFPDYRLKIVGRGYEREALGSLVLDLRLGDRVDFVDAMEEDALRAEYARSRCFVLPSEQEGFGIVLLEAMAAGTPVIALDAPYSAAASVVRHGEDGVLVANVEEMGTALAALLGDEEQWHRLSEGGRSTALRFDWDTVVVPRAEAFYRDTLAGERSRAISA